MRCTARDRGVGLLGDLGRLRAFSATCWIDADSSVTAAVELSILSVWSLSALEHLLRRRADLHVGEVGDLVVRRHVDALGQIAGALGDLRAWRG